MVVRAARQSLLPFIKSLMSKGSIMSRLIVITGGSRGIGFGIATCFARLGERIAILDVDPLAAAAAAEKLQAAGAGPSIGLACDVVDRAQVAAAIAILDRDHGGIDVLINNAGICPFIDIMDLEPRVWQRTMDVNMTGAFHCTQLAAAGMIKRGRGGRMLFVTSLAENVTGPMQVDYGASKAGLRMTMVGFATALGKHGITCNAIAPGMILTDMTAHHWTLPGPAAEIKARVPVGRIGTPEDIGHAAVFLASTGAAYVNGITIRVDGGHQAVCV